MLSVWQATIVNTAGDIVPGATVTVRQESSGALAQIFEDVDGEDPLSNPFTVTDPNAFVRFYAAADLYRIDVEYGDTGRIWRHVALGIDSDAVREALGDDTYLFRLTTAEASEGLTSFDVRFGYPPGHVYRYGANTTPGTTDMTAAINKAADVCRAGGYTLMLGDETCLFTSSLDFTGCDVRGPTGKRAAVLSGPHLQASSAVFDCILSTGNSFFRDFFVHGGWDGSTGGLGGDIFHFMDPLAYNIHIDNVTAMYAKRSFIRWSGSAYSSINRFRGVVAGNHGLEFDDTEAICTTVDVGGNSQFSSVPNGFGIAVLGESHGLNFSGCIVEDTQGMIVSGDNCRSLTFNRITQENFTVVSTTFLDVSSGSCDGLTITNNFGIGRVITGLSGCANVVQHNNVGIREDATPLSGRVISNTPSTVNTTTTGGVSITSGSVTLPPGTYLIIATVQTLQNTASSLTGAACQITTDSSASGLNNNVNSDFGDGCDEARITPNDGAMDVRLNAFKIYQNTTTGDVDVYLRTWVKFSGAGTLSTRGSIRAIKFT